MATAAVPDVPEASAAAPPAAHKQAESPRTDGESGGECSSRTSSPSGEADAGKAGDGDGAAPAPRTPPAAARPAQRPPPLHLTRQDAEDGADADDQALRAKAGPGSGLTDEEMDEEEDGEVLDGADLGTPLAYGGGAGFGEDGEFATHQFYGPSAAGGGSSARVLHSLRRVHIHDKPPRFCSEPPPASGLVHSDSSCSTVGSSGSLSRRTSSNASGASAGASDARPSAPCTSSRSHSEADPSMGAAPPLTFSVTFEEPVLGFQTNVVVSLENEVVVEVGSVERDGPAHRAGVRPGDWLVRVNGQALEPSMAREEVLGIVQRAARPRVLVFEREAGGSGGGGQDRRHESVSSGSDGASAKSTERKAPKQLMGRLSSAVSFGSSIIGSKWKRKKPVVHADSFCDGCGMDPIVGALWTCSVCSSYNLCTECYEMGAHGLEASDQMQLLSEALVQFKLLKRCKHFTPEFLLSLRRDVCKGRPDKFEYMGGWIAEIVNGTPPSKITVRGIEVPSLPASSRQRFVAKLMGLVSNRRDIEVNIEWLPDDSPPRASCIGFDEPALADGEALEKLRIWISDKKTRTTSPFA